MIQKIVAEKITAFVQKDPGIIGLAAAGSWITGKLDEFSDLDLVLVTKEKIGGDREKMLAYARMFGDFISGFTGEHVGEPRLLVCLYDNPLLHVDIKFVTLKELEVRVENPVVLFERDNQLTAIISNTKSSWPQPEYQWIEDRIWTWVHYITGKAARGEYFECLDGLGYIRANVLAPLLMIKEKVPPRALRKVEANLSETDVESLKGTVAQHDKNSIWKALLNAINIYRSLRNQLYGSDVLLQAKAEKKAMEYMKEYYPEAKYQ